MDNSTIVRVQGLTKHFPAGRGSLALSALTGQGVDGAGGDVGQVCLAGRPARGLLCPGGVAGQPRQGQAAGRRRPPLKQPPAGDRRAGHNRFSSRRGVQD